MKNLLCLTLAFLLFTGSYAQDFCPGNLFTNGDLELGTPTGGDQDINNATGFSSIWGSGSLADFYAYNAGPFTPPAPATGNYAGLWISNHASSSTTYREGLYNALNTPLANGSGIYSFTFDIACLYGWGASEVGIYGIYNPGAALSATPISSHNPSNENLFGPANTVLLGTVPVGGPGCDLNKTNQTITFDSGAAGFPLNGMTHVLITHSNDTIAGAIYVGLDNFCMQLEAPAEDTCAAVIDETISCDASGYTYTFTVQNNTGQLVDGIIVNGQYDPVVSIPAGGTYGPVTATIGASSANNYCFDVVLFSEDLACCHYEHCIELPPCSPCDSVELVANQLLSDPTVDVEGCCYEIDVINNFDDQYFTKIVSTILTSGVQFDNPYGDNGWTATPTGTSVLTWTPSTSYIDDISDSGVLNFCLSNITQVSQMPQTIQFDWVVTNANGQDSIVCSEVLTFECEPCLNVVNDGIECLANGDYYYCMTIENNDATHTATEVYFDVYTPAATQFTPNSIPVTIPPMGSASVCVTIPGPLAPGTDVQYKTILKNFAGDTLNWCCVVDTFRVTIPDCGQQTECAQIEDFYLECLEDLDGDGQVEYQLHIEAYGYGDIQLNSPCGLIVPALINVAGTASVDVVLYSNGTCGSGFFFTATTHDATGMICFESQYETELPDCPNDGCFCDKLQDDVLDGFDAVFNCPDGFFTPLSLGDCDEVYWFMDGQMLGSSSGDETFEMTYPGVGEYEICMRVIRTDDNGEICDATLCEVIQIDTWCLIQSEYEMVKMSLFPNPADDYLNIDLRKVNWEGTLQISTLDSKGSVQQSLTRVMADQIRLDIANLTSGIYIIRVQNEKGEALTQQFIKTKR